jgi:hypothetical protein
MHTPNRSNVFQMVRFGAGQTYKIQINQIGHRACLQNTYPMFDNMMTNRPGGMVKWNLWVVRSNRAIKRRKKKQTHISGVDVMITVDNFLWFSPIFGRKRAGFSSITYVMIKCLQKLTGVWAKNDTLVAQFWAKIFLNHNTCHSAAFFNVSANIARNLKKILINFALCF